MEKSQKMRLQQQLEFILELDKLKGIERRSYLLETSRLENSAEHSWHLTVATLVLAEYAESSLDVLRVMKMTLFHDIVEIDAGDTFLYDEQGNAEKAEREQEAAERLFGLLPPDQGKEYRSLWNEFEERTSLEARWARGLDRLLPLMFNYFTQGKTWREHGVNRDQVIRQNSIIADASSPLWRFAKSLIDDAVKRGYLSDGKSGEIR